MKRNDQIRDSKPQDHAHTAQRSLLSLAAAVLIIAGAPVMPCLGQTGSPDPAPADMTHILSLRDAALDQADQQYAKGVDSADKAYEQSLSEARTAWSAKVTAAKSAAVTDLKALSSRLAAAGRLSDMITVLKAVYSMTTQDPTTTQALVAAGVDIETIQPELDYFARCNGKQPSRIVIWNTHNSRFNTSGTLQLNVVLFHANRPVWRSDKVALPWGRNKDTFAVVNVPTMKFDIVRIEIVKWHGYSGGLSEVEIWQDGRNVALRKATRASAAASGQTTSDRVTDGVTTSSAYKNGYWLLPDNQPGWVEISLASPPYEQLVRARVSAKEPWQEMLEVTKGDIIDIAASGTWRASQEIVAGPDGGLGLEEDEWGKYSDRFYLQGRLNGVVFKIGSRFTLRVPQAGHLEMGMNEANVDWHMNNSGFLDVILKTRKRSPLP